MSEALADFLLQLVDYNFLLCAGRGLLLQFILKLVYLGLELPLLVLDLPHVEVVLRERLLHARVHQLQLLLLLAQGLTCILGFDAVGFNLGVRLDFELFQLLLEICDFFSLNYVFLNALLYFREEFRTRVVVVVLLLLD